MLAVNVDARMTLLVTESMQDRGRLNSRLEFIMLSSLVKGSVGFVVVSVRCGYSFILSFPGFGSRSCSQTQCVLSLVQHKWHIIGLLFRWPFCGFWFHSFKRAITKNNP